MISHSEQITTQEEDDLSPGFAWLLASGILFLLVWFHSGYLLGKEDYCLSDITYYFQPFCHFMKEALMEGRLPLWNPLLYCGMSQIAVPSPGFFYPFTLLLIFLPFSQGLAIYLLLHQAIAGLGAYLFVRSCNWTRLAAIVAVTVTCLCGYMFALAANFTLIATIAWLPLSLYLLNRLKADFTAANMFVFVGLSLTIFMTVAAGRPEVGVPSLLITGLYAVSLYCRSSSNSSNTELATVRLANIRSANIRLVFFALLAMVCGVLLALPIIVPALEWAKLSPRATGLNAKWVLMWSANWFDWLNLVLGYPLGDLCKIGIHGSPYRDMVASRVGALPFLTSSYIGPGVLTLAICGFLDKQWKARFPVAAIGTGLALMAAGKFTPFAPAVISLSPFLSTFRYPVKLMIFPALILALAAARGIYVLQQKRAGNGFLIGCTSFWFAIFVLGLIMVSFPDLAQITTHYPWLQGKNFPMEPMVQVQILLGESLRTASVFGALPCFLYWLYQSNRIKLKLFAAGLIFYLAMQLFYFSYEYARHSATAGYFEKPSFLVARLKTLLSKENDLAGKRVLALHRDPLVVPRYRSSNERAFDETYYQYARSVMLSNTNLNFGIAETGGYEAAETKHFQKLYRQILLTTTQNLRSKVLGKTDYALARFCQLTATNFVLTQARTKKDSKIVAAPKLDTSLFELVDDDQKENMRIYKCINTCPRIYLAQSIKQVPNWHKFTPDICEPKNKDLLTDVFVEANTVSISKPTGQGKLILLKDKPEEIEISAEITESQLLVLVDHFYPGWTASVDGKPVPILRVNLFNRGIELPAGNHKITFAYKPFGF
ncbi:MAG: YfhO family protein [Candidatus Obscuribacterales bacterium]|nr:YfhO family protein [Candidatus Obscuribacterales bacterium]